MSTASAFDMCFWSGFQNSSILLIYSFSQFYMSHNIFLVYQFCLQHGCAVVRFVVHACTMVSEDMLQNFGSTQTTIQHLLCQMYMTKQRSMLKIYSEIVLSTILYKPARICIFTLVTRPYEKCNCFFFYWHPQESEQY